VSLVRQMASLVAGAIYRPTDQIAEEYHKWYYGTMIWKTTTWRGISCLKSVSDMWNYQEILCQLKPSLVVEFGSRFGGAAVFFADVLRGQPNPFKVLSVDITHKNLDERARHDPDVVFMKSSSTVPAVAERIQQLRSEFPGPVFAILDSDHAKEHVLAEMKLLRPVLTSGDYLVVEDSNVNGHPVLPGFGPGPFEAIGAYEREFPDDYVHDRVRSGKFGWTFATNGFLIRRGAE